MEYTIYKIVCNDLNVKYCYVGSTMAFYKRKHDHKNNCNYENRNHLKIYTTINENGGWTNWEMIKIETVVCETKLDARKRERYWYEKLNADMNSIYPQRDDKEYRETNKDKFKEYLKAYYENNKDKAKKYYEENKEHISERKKEYYEANKKKHQKYIDELIEH